MEIELLDVFFKKKYQIFINIRPVAAEVFQADRQTKGRRTGMMKLIVTYAILRTRLKLHL
jgi:hypothetical protein